MPPAAASFPSDPAFAYARGQLEAMRSGMRMAIVASFVGMAAINGPAIAKLCSAGIREEFDAADVG